MSDEDEEVGEFLENNVSSNSPATPAVPLVPHPPPSPPAVVENNVVTINDADDDDNFGLHTCWVCYGTEDDQPGAEWVNPCRCIGSTKWVHHVCLMRWIDEKQRGQTQTKVSCPQCNTEYVIYFPSLGLFSESLQLIDRFIFKSSPAIATGVALTSIYWSATTYGAISLMQVLGHKEGLDLMEKTDPLFLLVGLPTIPVVMICGKMVPWDDYILKLWRRNAYKIPLLNYLFSLEDPNKYRSNLIATDTGPIREIKFTRVFCGAMLFPTIAALVGKFAYRNIQGNFKRSILGGITFVMVKGILKIYLQQRVYNMSGHRKVAQYQGDDREGTPEVVTSPLQAERALREQRRARQRRAPDGHLDNPPPVEPPGPSNAS